jgi:hypothetical protein
VFFSSTATATLGVLHWDGTVITQVWTAGTNWSVAFETSSGDVFLSGTVTTAVGILHWTGEALEQVWTVGYNWTGFETSAGNVYFGGAPSTAVGILRWVDGEMVQIGTTGYGFTVWYEHIDGTVFVSTLTVITAVAGIWKVSDGTLTRVYAGNAKWGVWYYNPNIGLLVSTSAVAYGLLRWNGTSFSVVVSQGSFEAAYTGDGFVIFANASPSGGIPRVTASGYTVAYPQGAWNIEARDGKILAYQTTPAGLLEYDDVSGTFSIVEPGYSGGEFQGDWTLFLGSTTAGTARLYKDGLTQAMETYYAAKLVNGNHAVAYNTATKRLLWVED